MSSTEKHLEQLSDRAGGLFPVPDEAAREYAVQRDVLAQCVDQALADHPEADRLVGGDRELMRANHRNHAEFMASVFALDAPELLVRMLPWVYRTYRAHGFSDDYFPVELAAWREAVGQFVEQPGPLQAVYDWMVEVHDEIVDLSREVDLGRLYEPQALSDDAEAVLGVLIRGESGRFLEAVGERVRTGEDLAEFYSQVITPVMYRIGELWERDEISAAQEHLVTAIVARGMSMACVGLPKPESARGRVLVACATREYHELGARMVADVLEVDGWDVLFTGANVPRGDLLRYANQVRPHLVCLSVTVPTNLSMVRQMAEELRQELDPTPRIMIGGQAVSGRLNLCHKLHVDACPASAEQARRLARDWWQEMEAS